MAKRFLRYMGEFFSRAGIVWRVEILQAAEQPFSEIGSLTFEADEALVIEWSHSEKEQVICGSTATLRPESPGDRTYEDLYTITPGRIVMDVYREGALYWSGTLDPEFYEEPYELAANYPVSLTFSDLGVLDRLKYDQSGMLTLHDVVDYCIGRAGFNTILDESIISTSLTPGGLRMKLSDLKVRSDNFYDEDGEALSLKEVLEGILQPLALRMIQRAGHLYIYDLNALYHTPSNEVYWEGDSQTMGTDRVYNNAKITWNTYAQSSELSDEECWILEVDPDFTALNNLEGKHPYTDDNPFGEDRVYSYHYGSNPFDVDTRTDYSGVGFSLWTSKQGKGAELKNSNVRFFKIVPQNEGSETEGVALTWISTYVEPTTAHDAEMKTKRNGVYSSIAGSFDTCGSVLFETTPVWIPPVSKTLDLCVNMEALVDPRINFYNEATNFYTGFLSGWFQKYAYNKWQKDANFVYAPVRILFRRDDGKTFCWDNRFSVKGAVYDVKSIEFTKGEWVEDTGNVWGYLAYYDPEDRKDNTGVLGWQQNRPAINAHKEKLLLALQKAKGQYIPYPMVDASLGGYISIEVLSGWVVKNDNGKDCPLLSDGNVAWVMCKLPTISIANASLFGKEINTDDIEYNADINPEAKDPIELDTICGSSAEGVPTARGAYFSALTGEQITQLTRAGRTSQVEDLLIGTLFSQFGERHTTLSGEMSIVTQGLITYTEANQDGKKFMITADVQDVITDISDATITELRPDEYERRD